MLERGNLIIQGPDGLLGFLNRSSVLAAIRLPAIDALLFRVLATILGVEFLTKFALLCQIVCFIDEFHAASLTTTILLLAVLAKVAPFEVKAGEDVLVVETHGGCTRCTRWPG